MGGTSPARTSLAGSKVGKDDRVLVRSEVGQGRVLAQKYGIWGRQIGHEQVWSESIRGYLLCQLNVSAQIGWSASIAGVLERSGR